MNKLPNLLIKKIIQYCIQGKFKIHEYDKYKIDQLSSMYSMKYKDNNVDLIIRLSLVCKLWAIKIIPYLNYPFYQVVNSELIPTHTRFGISKHLIQFNNPIELDRISLLISDTLHNNIQVKSDSDSLSILNTRYNFNNNTINNKRDYQPLLFNLFFLSYGFDIYFKLVINKINETSYFFEKLQHITVIIESQNEMSALRKCLYQISTIKSLNIIISKTTASSSTNTSTITTTMSTTGINNTTNNNNNNLPSNIITVGLANSIENHPSLERISFSGGNFCLPINCKNKIKELKIKDIIIKNLDDPSTNGTGTTSTTSTTTNYINESLSKLIENNLESLTRITLRDFYIENQSIPKVIPGTFFDTDPNQMLDNSIREITTIFSILSKSKVLEYLDIKTIDIPYYSIRELIIGCKSLKSLHIKLTSSSSSNNTNNNTNNNNTNSLPLLPIINNTTITTQITTQPINTNNNIEIIEDDNNNNNINLIDYTFISMANSPAPIIPLSKTINYLNVPKLNTQFIISPIILNNLVTIVHDGSQTKDFKYLIPLIENTKSLSKLVIKSVKSNSTTSNNSNNNNNNNNSKVLILNQISKDWNQLFKCISDNKTLSTLHLLECPSLDTNIIDQFILSQHPTIVNVKFHRINFTISSFYNNHTFENVNIIITCDNLSQLLVKNSTIKQLKCNIIEYSTPFSSIEYLAKSLKVTKILSIQLNRNLIHWSSNNLLKHLKNFSYPI